MLLGSRRNMADTMEIPKSRLIEAKQVRHKYMHDPYLSSYYP